MAFLATLNNIHGSETRRGSGDLQCRGLGFRGLGLMGLGFRGLGLMGLGFRGLGLMGLGFRGLGWAMGFLFAKGWLHPGLARPLRISYKFLLLVALGSLPHERKKEINKEQKNDINQERNKDRTKDGNEEKKETKKEQNKENLA